MNLHSIVAPYVAAVNPPLLCSLQQSNGYTTGSTGKRVPTYDAAVPLWCQCQALQYNDLVQTSSLNIQGKRLAVYIQGNWDGVVRNDSKGGDLVTLPNGTVWLCAMVLENWSQSSGWTKVCLTEQNGA